MLPWVTRRSKRNRQGVKPFKESNGSLINFKQRRTGCCRYLLACMYTSYICRVPPLVFSETFFFLKKKKRKTLTMLWDISVIFYILLLGVWLLEKVRKYDWWWMALSPASLTIPWLYTQGLSLACGWWHAQCLRTHWLTGGRGILQALWLIEWLYVSVSDAGSH